MKLKVMCLVMVSLFPATASFARAAMTVNQALVRIGTLAVPCVTKEGFKLIPYAPSTILDDVNTVDFSKLWGFGISTTIEDPKVVYAKPDPNLEYARSLSPESKAEYQKVIARCINQAMKGNPGDPAVILLSSLLQQEQRPKLTKAQRDDLRKCITSLGYGRYGTKEEIAGLFFTRSEDTIGYPPPVRWSNGVISVSRSSRKSPALTDETKAALKQIKADERSAALGVFSCEQKL